MSPRLGVRSGCRFRCSVTNPIINRCVPFELFYAGVAPMNADALRATARALVACDKGLLAIDESVGTCNARLAEAGIPQTPESRRAYRDMLVTTPDLGTCISGAILFDETIRQTTASGTPFISVLADAGIIPGIKVDIGALPLALYPREQITEGLDGLRSRLQEYAKLGARFAKWRAVLVVSDGLPSEGCTEANAHALARYAALCQEAGLVPIVEPEVLMTGDQTLERSRRVTESVLERVFAQINLQEVMLEAMILKPSMVLSGTTSLTQAKVEEVAEATVRSLLRVVPAAVPGIAFLSGGQPGELATARLHAMHAGFATPMAPAPWALTFSFGRALQRPAIGIWGGHESQRGPAQRALLHRARCNRAAVRGEYTAAMENDSNARLSDVT
jgi:fructose-bisphosphate aldolase class I